MPNFDETGVYSLGDIDPAKARADLAKAKAEAEKRFSKVKPYDSPKQPGEKEQPPS